jgi:hypothetical protein
MTIPEGFRRLKNIPKEVRGKLLKPYGITVKVSGASGYMVMQRDGTVRDPMDTQGTNAKKVPIEDVFVLKKRRLHS